jgi:hypothetical protein
MPSWIDAKKNIDTMLKCQHQSSTKFAQDELDKKVETVHHEKRYKTAYKEVTLMIEKSWSDPLLFAKKGNGIRALYPVVSDLWPDTNVYTKEYVL